MGSHERRTGNARPLLIRDHERLDALFVKLLEAFLDGDPADMRATWTRFDAGLRAHFDAEERYLLPLFGRVDPAEAAGLLAEHAVFRRALDDLGVGVDLHMVRLDVAHAFIQGLRAHAHREDELFYRWAERLADDGGEAGPVPPCGRASGRAACAAAPRAS